MLKAQLKKAYDQIAETVQMLNSMPENAGAVNLLFEILFSGGIK